MKNFSNIIFISLLLFLFSCETSNETTSGKNIADSPESGGDETAQMASIAYSGTGQVGEAPVTWEVNIAKNVITGTYQYRGQDAQLSLSGEYLNGQSLIAESDPDGKTTGRIELKNFPDPVWRGTWLGKNDAELPLSWTAEKAMLQSAAEGWPKEGLMLTAKEVSLYTPDSMCHVIHKVWRAAGNSPIARAFNAVTQPPSFQDRKVGLTDCMIELEDREVTEDFPSSGEESVVRLGSLTGNILPIHFDYFSYYAGAAHGNYGSETVHLLLPDLEEITLDQLFTEGFRSVLSEKVKMGLDQQFGDDAGLEYKGLPDEFNYEIQPEQIVVYFNPYEIGPYVLGRIQVAVSYEEIRTIIRENGPLMRL